LPRATSLAAQAGACGTVSSAIPVIAAARLVLVRAIL
jgi:hypothetical protein